MYHGMGENGISQAAAMIDCVSRGGTWTGTACKEPAKVGDVCGLLSVCPPGTRCVSRPRAPDWDWQSRCRLTQQPPAPGTPGGTPASGRNGVETEFKLVGGEAPTGPTVPAAVAANGQVKTPGWVWAAAIGVGAIAVYAAYRMREVK